MKTARSTLTSLRSCKLVLFNDTKMSDSSNGNIFRVTGFLWGDFTGNRWIPRKKAIEAELWCFLSSEPVLTVLQTMETPVILEAMALIMTLLQWFQCILLWLCIFQSIRHRYISFMCRKITVPSCHLQYHPFPTWWCFDMEMFFSLLAPLWVQSTGNQWIPFIMGQQCGAMVFFHCQPAQAVQQECELTAIRDCNEV